MLTPVYSEGQLEMVDNFNGIFKDDHEYQVQAGQKLNEEQQRLLDEERKPKELQVLFNEIFEKEHKVEPDPEPMDV